MLVNPERTHVINEGKDTGGPVIYWMSREQRVQDNWGLLYARDLAGAGRALVVGFCIAPPFLGETLRQYEFMIRGLEETAERLAELGIPFALRMGDPGREIAELVREIGAGVVVTDFDPLRIKREWVKYAASAVDVSLIEVDGHNVVPARRVTDKQEYAARTIRPKIHRLLPEYLEEFPELPPQQAQCPDIAPPDWAEARNSMPMDDSVEVVDLDSGEDAAQAALADFINYRLFGYAQKRNDPVAEHTSRLSAYFHFGQLAPQRAALDVAATGAGEDQKDYLEELIIRRELSDNFCLHNPAYDSLKGAPEWARKTLDEHRSDPRPHLYNHERFDRAETHSALWNAAQNQLRTTGHMHGYMRMFWAKKILEWSRSPEKALYTVITLNDRYQLDGRDPNGYVGALWSVAGLHDRPWQNRPIFGAVRYMNENGCRRKFRVDEYIARYSPE